MFTKLGGLKLRPRVDRPCTEKGNLAFPGVWLQSLVKQCGSVPPAENNFTFNRHASAQICEWTSVPVEPSPFVLVVLDDGLR